VAPGETQETEEARGRDGPQRAQTRPMRRRPREARFGEVVAHATWARAQVEPFDATANGLSTIRHCGLTRAVCLERVGGIERVNSSGVFDVLRDGGLSETAPFATPVQL
jgi:hypothetical protein